jgi:hypothetical protein
MVSLYKQPKSRCKEILDTKKDLHEVLDLGIQTMKTPVETTQPGPQARLVKVTAGSACSSSTGTKFSRVKTPKLDGSALWAVFCHKFETATQYYKWTPCVKVWHLLAALQGWVSDVLHGVSKGVTYEETI